LFALKTGKVKYARSGVRTVCSILPEAAAAG
jgi:hypothetical protein